MQGFFPQAYIRSILQMYSRLGYLVAEVGTAPTEFGL